MIRKYNTVYSFTKQCYNFIDHKRIEFSVTMDAKIVSMYFIRLLWKDICGVDEIVMYKVIELEIIFIYFTISS